MDARRKLGSLLRPFVFLALASFAGGRAAYGGAEPVSLAVSVAGSGDVRYGGSASTVHSSMAGSGSVRKR